MGKLKETILYSRLKSKDREAFIEMYDLYADKIYRFIFFKIGNEEEAKDLTSSVFLKAWNYININRLKDYDSLKSLVYKIARNAVIDYYRAASVQNNLPLDDELARRIPSESEESALESRAEIFSDFELVRKKMAELKDEYREIIILRFIEDLSIGEIAKVVDKSKGNVRVLTYRALKALKDLIEQDNKFKQ
jgi:RNA polymerase sigma-70 factor (ECF subfamily)